MSRIYNLTQTPFVSPFLMQRLVDETLTSTPP
jgi:hypothetical protein